MNIKRKLGLAFKATTLTFPKEFSLFPFFDFPNSYFPENFWMNLS